MHQLFSGFNTQLVDTGQLQHRAMTRSAILIPACTYIVPPILQNLTHTRRRLAACGHMSIDTPRLREFTARAEVCLPPLWAKQDGSEGE